MGRSPEMIGRFVYKILIVEDSKEFELVLRQVLARIEAKLFFAENLVKAKKCLENIGADSINLILLDLQLPDGDGLAFLDEIRRNENTKNIPILVISVETSLTAKVAAFSLGAEDYLVKPVNPIELRARIEMHLRKVQQNRQHDLLLRKPNLTINTATFKASLLENGNEATLDLTGKEFQILSFLARNEGKVYSRAQLVKAVWDAKIHVLDRTVDSHVCSLRKKMKGAARYIECVPGVGYRFSADNPSL